MPEVAPGGIVTVAGTLTSVLELFKLTMTPPTGAGPDKVKVPVDAVPAATDDGAKVNPVRVGRETVRFAVFMTPPWVATIGTN